MKVPKRAVKKKAKPLASALTVANPVECQPGLLQELPKAGMAAQRIGEQAKPVLQLPPTKLSATPVVAEKAPIPTASRTANVVFVLNAPQAKNASLCGEFNQWVLDAAPMKRQSDGTWKVSLELRPGRYQYKFVVDGQWMHDPKAGENVPNSQGSFNSVVDVGA